MRLISDADEELFHTVIVAARLGKAGKVVDWLSSRYEDDLAAESAFQFALAMMAVLQVDGEEFIRRAGYTEVIEALGDVLYEHPDHWPARYGRIRLRALVPSRFGVYQEYLAAEQANAVEDVAELLRRQEAQPAAQPYFQCTYLLGAQLQLAMGNTDAAADLIARAGDRVSGALNLPALGGMLSEPFIAVYQQVHGTERELVGEMLAELFAGHPAIQTVLQRDPVG